MIKKVQWHVLAHWKVSFSIFFLDHRLYILKAYIHKTDLIHIGSFKLNKVVNGLQSETGNQYILLIKLDLHVVWQWYRQNKCWEILPNKTHFVSIYILLFLYMYTRVAILVSTLSSDWFSLYCISLLVNAFSWILYWHLSFN